MAIPARRVALPLHFSAVNGGVLKGVVVVVVPHCKDTTAVQHAERTARTHH
jgi:hypothetical protein